MVEGFCELADVPADSLRSPAVWWNTTVCDTPGLLMMHVWNQGAHRESMRESDVNRKVLPGNPTEERRSKTSNVWYNISEDCAHFTPTAIQQAGRCGLPSQQCEGGAPVPRRCRQQPERCPASGLVARTLIDDRFWRGPDSKAVRKGVRKAALTPKTCPGSVLRTLMTVRLGAGVHSGKIARGGKTNGEYLKDGVKTYRRVAGTQPPDIIVFGSGYWCGTAAVTSGTL